MATIRQVRQRIKVAKNIQQITKAMKMVAAARLKKAHVFQTAKTEDFPQNNDILASCSTHNSKNCFSDDSIGPISFESGFYFKFPVFQPP